MRFTCVSWATNRGNVRTWQKVGLGAGSVGSVVVVAVFSLELAGGLASLLAAFWGIVVILKRNVSLRDTAAQNPAVAEALDPQAFRRFQKVFKQEGTGTPPPEPEATVIGSLRLRPSGSETPAVVPDYDPENSEFSGVLAEEDQVSVSVSRQGRSKAERSRPLPHPYQAAARKPPEKPKTPTTEPAEATQQKLVTLPSAPASQDQLPAENQTSEPEGATLEQFLDADLPSFPQPPEATNSPTQYRDGESIAENLQENYGEWYLDDLGAQLAESSGSQEKQAEAEALLEMAHLAREGEHWEDTLASLSAHLQILRDLGAPPSNQALQLHAQAALQTGAVSAALNSLGQVWGNLAPPEREEYAEVVLELTRNLVREQQDEQALPHLQALESHFQENKDTARLDMLYDLLEQVYERGGDPLLLVVAYKQHLEVKRTLDDHPGQGRLLDLLGTHYYQQGDRSASRQYYEDQLRLKSP